MSFFVKTKDKQNEIKKLNKKIRKALPKSRYNHSVGVAFTSSSLAMKYKADIHAALIAGLLHDCAKGYTGKELLLLCDKYSIIPSEAEKRSPELLHAKIGSAIARDIYKITDEDILNAIASHTTGHANMTLLEKIVFIADYIEPSRKNIPNLDDIREMAFTDIDKCIIAVTKGTINHLKEKKAEIDPLTQETMDYYLSQYGDISNESN